MRLARIIAVRRAPVSRRLYRWEVVGALQLNVLAAGSDHVILAGLALSVRNAAIFSTQNRSASRQLTDLYLLAHNGGRSTGGRLVGSNQGIPATPP